MITIYQRFTGNPSQPAVTVDGSGNVIPQDQVSTTQVMPGTADDYGQLKTQEILNPNMTFGGFQDPSGKVFNNTGTLTMADNAILQSIPGAGSVQKSDTVQGYSYVPDNGETISTAGDDGWTKFWGDYGPLIAVGGAGGFLGAAALGAGALSGAAGATGATSSAAPVLGGNLDALAGSGAFGAGNVGLAGSEVAAGGTGSLADLATQAGDIGGAAFPTDAATIAGQQGTLGALGTAGADVIGPNGLNGYDPTMSGLPGNATAGLQDFVQGALQSGNYSQLLKLLPSLPTGSQTALQRIISGNSSAADWAQLGLQALPGVLGAVGASQQAGALSDLADKQFAVGAPSRARYEAAMTPGFDPTTIPGYSGALASTSQAVLSKLSANGGNPYGNPGGLISANQQIVNGTALPAIQNYESQNAATGGYSAFNSAAPNTATSAIGANSGVLSALGSAASSVVNPPQSLAALLKQYGLGSSSTNTLSSLQ